MYNQNSPTFASISKKTENYFTFSKLFLLTNWANFFFFVSKYNTIIFSVHKHLHAGDVINLIFWNVMILVRLDIRKSYENNFFFPPCYCLTTIWHWIVKLGEGWYPCRRDVLFHQQYTQYKIFILVGWLSLLVVARSSLAATWLSYQMSSE